MKCFHPLQVLRHPASYAVVFFGFICWIIFLADSGRESVFFTFVEQLPLGDKLGHAGLFGVLALLANLGFGLRYLKHPAIQLGSLAVLVFALGEELTQYFFPQRTMDLADAAADIFGITVATLISLWIRRKNTRLSR